MKTHLATCFAASFHTFRPVQYTIITSFVCIFTTQILDLYTTTRVLRIQSHAMCGIEDETVHAAQESAAWS